MIKRKTRVKLIAASVGALLLSGAVAQAASYESEMVIIHPFQWSYNSIAKECTEYLGPAGVDGVQISQPAEHISNTSNWWAVYQPVNFKNFTTMTGNESELRAMIKTCNDAGVKIFADAVFNQRGSSGNTGLGGSHFDAGSYYYPDLDSSNFHSKCSISSYGDAYSVRNCALSGMPDLKTEDNATQEKIADYLVSLHNMGVYGFRVDAAKHMGYTDLESIFQKVASKLGGVRPPAYYEVIGANGEAADIQPEKYIGNGNTVVTDFGYVGTMTNTFQNGNYGNALNIGGSLGSDNSEVFVNNHDDEYLRCSAGTCSMPTQNNQKYNMAQSWLVVWPYGKVRQVYSGYAFSQHDPAGPISAARCEGGWLCQHREPMVLNAFRFARATRGQAVTTKAYTDNALWINRGSKGFYVMNTSNNEFTREFSVEVPDGTYCDILGNIDPCGGNKITVSGGKATIKVAGQHAAAICVGEWCGEQVDPCETDPSSAACLCSNSSDKSTCDAYCSSSGSQSQACLCKGEETNSKGQCQSYCTLNPSADGCYCLLNPNEEECQIRYTTTKNLCYAGTSNAWQMDKMTFSAATGKWTISLNLDGAGDTSGAQRFKVTDGCSWQGTVYGKGSSSDSLKVNTSASGDVQMSQIGKYVLSIDDQTMKFTLTQETTQNHEPVAAFTAVTSGLTVTLNNTSSDQDGDTLTYAWNFGNGQSSTLKSPTVTYSSKGTYNISLVVTDSKGASNKKDYSVTVIPADQQVFSKVALRSSEDDFGTVLFTQDSSDKDIWVLSDYAFSKGANKFKIEALNGSQCVIVGGEEGKALTAAGAFIAVEDGSYDITFNAKTMVLSIKSHETPCVGDLCGQQCIAGDDCISGICQGTNCVLPDTPKNTKNNCTADGTTNNCESSAYAYDFLGAIYSKTDTTFRIWSPDSSNVTVEVNGQSYTLNKTSINGYQNVYEVKVTGDLDQTPYQFKINGKAVRDPYGKMVVPTNYSGSDGVGVAASDNRNVVMNMRDTDLADGWAPRPAFINREDAVLYEAHVRDFTIDSSSGVSSEKKGRYLGMVETGTKSSDGLATGIDHLKELGITHVQLLPVYDYGSCSDVDSQSDSCYNWGYDPVNFNVPEDRYSSVFKTEQYKQKVKEFKEMVNEFHKNGIRVIMDVVYNHTYNKEMFQNITSKYYTSIDLSGCGNSTDPKEDMVSRFIQDSLEYWATEYNIDGFRFDLVGIFDIADFKQWGEYLNNKYPTRNFLMYGEPWNGYATDPSESTRVRLGTIRQGVSGHVGVFNGKYRECVKGGSDNAVGGFMFNTTYNDLGAGVSNNVECVSAGIKGAIGDNQNSWTPLFAADPEQSINYLTAHDNLTMADKIALMTSNAEYASRLQAYGNGIMLVSQGIPFLHAGVEFGRSKGGDHNSYKTPGDVNNIKWGLKKSNLATFNYYKEMIAMRRAHPAFRMTTRSQIESNVQTSGENGAIVVNINGAAVGDSWSNIKMVINSGNNMTISGVDGWKKKVHAVTVNSDGTTGTSTAEGTAVTIWYK